MEPNNTFNIESIEPNNTPPEESMGPNNATAGELKLTFRKKQSGETYIAEQYYALPLQVLPPYYQDEDGTAFTYLLNTAGGVFHGDRLLTEIKVEGGASVVVTTPSANKLYKMENDHAEIRSNFEVKEGGILEFIPEYNIPYASSNVYQDNTFRLHSGATLFAWDMVVPGRMDRGEYFDYDLYSSKIKIYVDNKLVAYEYSKLKPDEGTLAGIGVMEGYDIYTSIFIYRKRLPEALGEEIKETLDKEDTVMGGISFPDDSIACIKLLGTNVFETWEAMMNIWGITRKHLLGKRRVRIRKY